MYESVIFTGGTQNCICYRIINIAYLFICFKGLASEKSIYQPCPCWVKVRIINHIKKSIRYIKFYLGTS